MKIHALYVRVSTESQAEEGYSINAQTERLSAYGVAMGWEKTELFVDGGFSGSHLERPAMVELISMVKEGKIDSVVVYKLDRLSRSQKDTLFLIEDVFLPHNVDFISLNESIDTSTPYGRAMIGILSAFAQLERENIYQRTRMGMLERVKQGYWMGGGVVPFGYDYDKENGILTPNEREKEIVFQIYSLFIQGESPSRIAEKLGLGYDRLVMQIISRKSNLGLISYKGQEYQGRHQPIISQEMFDLAQKKRKSRQIVKKSGGVHLLTGLIFCKFCGSRLRYVRWGKKGYKLRCYSQDPSKQYMKGVKKCNEPAVWAEKVEEILLTDIKKVSVDLRQREGKNSSFNGELPKQIEKERLKLKRLYHLYGQDGEETLLSAIDESKKRLNRLILLLEEEKNKQESEQELSILKERICTLGETWNILNEPQKQEILRECIEKILINEDSVEIYYKFDGMERRD